MPTVVRPLRGRRDELDFYQRARLESGFDFGAGPAFASEADERAAWEWHRDMLIAEWRRPGTMPAAFWQFDVGIPVLTADDPTEPVDPDEWADCRARRQMIPNLDGTVHHGPHPAEHSELCYQLARGARLSARRSSWLDRNGGLG